MCNLTTIGVLPITANKQKLWGESSVERERNLLFKGYAVGNNGRILPQSPFPLRHPKKITLLFSAGSVQGCARSYFSHSKVHPLRNCSLISWFQSLSGFRHLSESVPDTLLTTLTSSSFCCPPVCLYTWLGRTPYSPAVRGRGVCARERRGACCLDTRPRLPPFLPYWPSACCIPSQASPHSSLEGTPTGDPRPRGQQGLPAQEI